MGAFMHPTLSKKRFRPKAEKIPDADNSSLDGKINVDDAIIPGLGGGRIILGGDTDARIEIDTRLTGTAKKIGRPIYLSVGGHISKEGHASNVVITQSNVKAYDRLLLAHSTGILIEKMCAKIDQLEATVTALYNWAKQMKVETDQFGQAASGFIQFRPGSPNTGDLGGWAVGNMPSLCIPEFKGSDWCKPEKTLAGKRVKLLGGSLPNPDLQGIGSDALSSYVDPKTHVKSASVGTKKAPITSRLNHIGFSAVALKQFPAMTMRGHAKDKKGYPSSTTYDDQAYWADRSKTTGEGQYLRFWADKTGDFNKSMSNSKKAIWYDWSGDYELHRELSRYCVGSTIRISPNSLWSEENRFAGGEGVPHKSPQVFVDLNPAPLAHTLTGGKYWTKDKYKHGGN
jgi:hypothetical protein